MKILTTIVFASSVLTACTTGKPLQQTDDTKSNVLQQQPADRTSEDTVSLVTAQTRNLEVASSKEKSPPQQKKIMFEPTTTESQAIAIETEQIEAKLSHKESFRNDNSNPEIDTHKDTGVLGSNSDDKSKNENPKTGLGSSEESPRAEVLKTKLGDSSTTKPSVSSPLVKKILNHVTSTTVSEDITKRSSDNVSADPPQQKELDETSTYRDILKTSPKSSSAESRDTHSSSSEKILDKLFETSSSEIVDQDKDHDDINDNEKKILIRKILRLSRREYNDENESTEDDNGDNDDSHKIELKDDEENDDEDVNATDVTVDPNSTVKPLLSDLTRQRLAELSRSKLQETLNMLRGMRNGKTRSTVPTKRSTSTTKRTTLPSRSRNLLKISMGEICCSFG